MKFSDLMNHWEKEFGGQLSEDSYQLKLSMEDAARLEALCEMFPKHSRDNILRDIINAGLSEITSNFPYIQGKEVVAHDEEGDPLYADIGPTPKFLSLTRKHMKQLAANKGQASH